MHAEENSVIGTTQRHLVKEQGPLPTTDPSSPTRKSEEDPHDEFGTPLLHPTASSRNLRS